MVAVKVGEAQPSDRAGRHTGQQQLTLRSLSRVEQHALTVPAQQVTVVIAVTGGHLAGGTEHDQLADRHLPTVRPSGVPTFTAGIPRGCPVGALFIHRPIRRNDHGCLYRPEPSSGLPLRCRLPGTQGPNRRCGNEKRLRGRARALRAMPPETYANMAEVLASVSLSDGTLDDADKAAARRTV